ncbi:MAG: lysostaphin resistance A-like protein [Bacilli bacterium]
MNYVKGSRIKSGINVGIYFASIFIFPSIIAVIYMIGLSITRGTLSSEEFNELVNSNILYIMAVSSLTTFLIILILNFKDLKKQFVLNLKNYLTYIYPLILFVAYFVVIYALSFIVNAINPDLAEPENNQALIDMFNDGNKLIFILNVVILAPLVEELIFRYSLVNLLDIEKTKLKWLPYFISAVVFAAIHEVGFITDFTVDNILLYLTYLAPALVLAFGYMFTKRNIVSMIILHMIINIFATIGIAAS